MKTPIRENWRFLRDILSGPGRNRTTNSRIFNPIISPNDLADTELSQKNDLRHYVCYGHLTDPD